MKVFVAGGSGFIGKNYLLGIPKDWEAVATYHTAEDFTDFLRENRLENVRAVQLDMRDDEQVKQMLASEGQTYDICLYVMGNSDIGLSRKTPTVDVQCNIHPLLNLLKHIRTSKFIFMSSGSVYEGYSDAVHPKMAVSPTIPYSVDKLASELFIQYYQKHTDSINEYVILRFFGAYGPMEPARKIYTNLVQTFAFENRSEFRMIGNGKNFIDAMYIDDAIEALLRISESNKGNVTVDLCCGEPLTINELVKQVGAIFGKDATISHEGSAAEYTTFYASPDAMKALFGFRIKTPLAEGMTKFADYLRRNAD